MASAKNKIKVYLFQHIGEDVSRETLREVSGNIQDWQRSLRQLRQETGLDISPTKTGYVLKSDIPINEPKLRGSINEKLRYAVLSRDNSTCQRCGANPLNTQNVKLVVDHKIPVELGGETNIDNLWTLCSNCNGGKKAFFQDEDTEQLRTIMQMESAQKRIKAYFELYPNTLLEPTKLSVIANVRDWERALRYVRFKENMNIEYIRPNKENQIGGYIYHK